MKTAMRIVTAAVVAAVLASPAAWAGGKTDTDYNKSKGGSASPSAAPARIDGEVVAVNPDAGTMTVRMSDGSTQEFRGNKETLKDYKVGDRIEGKLRK
jgi:hypothetical protein